MRLYTIKELREVSLAGYIKALNWGKINIGGSDNAVERFYHQSGTMFDEKGNVWVRK